MKMFIRRVATGAALFAAFAVVMAVTDASPSPYERASMLIVPTDAKRFNLVRNIPIMGESGEGWLSHGEIEYVDCRVPARNLLGKQGAGFVLAQERLGPVRSSCRSGLPAKTIVLGIAYALDPTGSIAANPSSAYFKDLESAEARKARWATMGKPTLRGRIGFRIL